MIELDEFAVGFVAFVVIEHEPVALEDGLSHQIIVVRLLAFGPLAVGPA